MTDLKKGRTILCVDDESNILNALKRLLRNEDYEVLTANSGPEGLQLLETHEVHVVVSDQRMPEMTGTEFLTQVKQKYPHIVRVILSGYTDVGAILEPIRTGELYRFLSKPWNDEEMKLNIRQSLSHYELVQLNKSLMEKINEQNQDLIHLKEQLEELIEKQAVALSCSQHVLDTLPIPWG